MRSWKRILLSAGLAAGGVSSTTAQTDTITIIYVNDTHSHLASIGPRTADLEGTVGGIARAATVVGGITATSPNPIFLHAGDLSVGDLFYNSYGGVPEYRILSALGCKAMAVGNHEFDLGPSVLLQSLSTAFERGGAFPLLSANIHLNDSLVQPLRKFITASTLVDCGDVRVGVFGLTTPATMTISRPQPAVVDTPFRYAAAMVKSLKERGCGVIVCLSHLGLMLDTVLAAAIPGIDLIVGGHDHVELAQAVPVQTTAHDTTWIVQAGAFYKNVGTVQLAAGKGTVRLLGASLVKVDTSVAKDPAVDSVVSSLVAEIEATQRPWYSRQIAWANGYFREAGDSLTIGGYRDTPIGDLVTDAMRAMTGTQISVEPGGSTAEPIEAGAIVADDLFRVVGYGFNPVSGSGYHLIRFTITGAALRAGLEFGLAAIEQDDEYFLQVSGMKYGYDPAAPPGSRVTGVTVNGAPLAADETYTVSSNYFVKGFLDYLQIPCSDFHEYGGDTTEFKALSEYVASRSPINPSMSGRITSAVKGGKTGELPRRKAPQRHSRWPFDEAFTGRASRSLSGNAPRDFFPGSALIASSHRSGSSITHTQERRDSGNEDFCVGPGHWNCGDAGWLRGVPGGVRSGRQRSRGGEPPAGQRDH